MWDMKGAYSIQVGRLERKNHLEILGVDGRIILKHPQHVEWGHGLDLFGSEVEQVVDSCECGNESSGSIQCGEFLD
jgi:hypothetical protein